MKNKLPYNTLIMIALILIFGIIIFATVGDFDGDSLFWVVFPAVAIAPVLVGEIIGIIIREKLHKPYADLIAVLIANVIALAVFVTYAIYDIMTSTAFLAGLLGTIILITMVPANGISLIINLVFFLLRRKKLKAASQNQPQPEINSDSAE